jgi:Ca-activated chloride channel family protein
MSGQKMKRAKEGAKYVLGYLEADDYLTLVQFNGSASVSIEGTQYGDLPRKQVVSRIDQLAAGGGTDIYDGLEKATAQLESMPSGSDVARRVLLLSDGKDNRRGPDDFDRQARRIDEKGIRIRAGGIGDEYDMETIRTLGTVARGQWEHIEQASEIQQFFGQAVEDASTVVGSDAELRMDIADGVEFTEVYRAVPQIQEINVEYQGNNVAVVKLPDLLERQEQQVLLKVQAPGHEADQKVTLADVTLRAGGKTTRGDITVQYTDDNNKLSVRNESVNIRLDEARTRVELGKGDVEAAETQIEQMEAKYGDEATADIQQLEQETTVVAEGGREEQEGATRIRSDDI